MKKYMFQTIILILILIVLGFFPSLAFSQPFPEKPAARLGKGTIGGELAYSPDGLLLAAAGSLGVWLYNAKDLRFITPRENAYALYLWVESQQEFMRKKKMRFIGMAEMIKVSGLVTACIFILFKRESLLI